MIWGCAGDIFEVLLKFKMATTDKHYICWWAQKLKVKNYIILQSNYPPNENMQVIQMKLGLKG